MVFMPRSSLGREVLARPTEQGAGAHEGPAEIGQHPLDAARPPDLIMQRLLVRLGGEQILERSNDPRDHRVVLGRELSGDLAGVPAARSADLLLLPIDREADHAQLVIDPVQIVHEPVQAAPLGLAVIAGKGRPDAAVARSA
jgi:hypothetical protein